MVVIGGLLVGYVVWLVFLFWVTTEVFYANFIGNSIMVSTMNYPRINELAEEIRRYPAVIGEDRILPPEPGATSGRQRADKSFADLLDRADIRGFRFHDLAHCLATLSYSLSIVGNRKVFR